jgi:methylphosphotriester-DNA--protein-cysteine methyltransferase
MPKHSCASKRDSRENVHARHDGKAKLHRHSGARPLGRIPDDSSSVAWLRRKLTIVANALWMILFCSNR